MAIAEVNADPVYPTHVNDNEVIVSSLHWIEAVLTCWVVQLNTKAQRLQR